jgi:hypothetical protein
MFRFVGKLVSLFLKLRSWLLLKHTKQMETSRALHLRKLLDRHHRRKRFALPFDDELVVTESNPVENITKLPANF